jgi:phage terminase small subunit
MVLVLTFAVGLALFYVEDLKDYRDRQQQRLEDERRIAACRLLDGLPEDYRALDDLRAENGCGPGVPYERLDPEVQRQFREQQQVWAPPLVSGQVLDPGDATQHPQD